MLQQKYILKENNKILHKSFYFEKLLNYTTTTTNAVIYYNDKIVWVQDTDNYYNEQ